MCTICIPNGEPCARHRDEYTAYVRWTRKHGDDIRALREDIRAGQVDFRDLEMAS